MKLGAEPKKVVVLGGLVVVGLYLFYANVLTDNAPPPERDSRPAASPAATSAPSIPSGSSGPPVARRNPGGRAGSQEFRPSLRPRRPEDRLDPTTIDPTLRLDLLAKVQSVGLEGGSRNLFQFGSAPPPETKIKETIINPKTPQKIAAEQAAKLADAGDGKPPPPQITLKYYGFTSAKGDSRKRAFFLDGEDILIAGEGDVVKRRYKVVRIGVNSVVMEDTEANVQQTIPLQEEAQA